MSVQFSDLVEPQTLDTVRGTFNSAAAAVSWAVDRLPPLARLRKLADVSVRTLYALTAVQAESIRSGFRDFARGQWLRALAEQQYGVTPIDETFATTEVTFTNVSTEPYSFQSEEVVVGNAVTGKTYKVPAFNLAPTGFDGDEVTVDVIAYEPGTGSDAAPGDITVMVNTFDGVSCTNAGAAKGLDTEEDEDLRRRMAASLAAISPGGAADAYRYIATSALREDGTAIGITRVQVVEDVPEIGDVTVYLADGDGAPAAEDVDLIHEQIMLIVRPVGVTYLGTFAATEIDVDVTYTALARASDGLTTDEIEQIANDALVSFFASATENPIGGNVIAPAATGSLYRSELIAVISQAQSSADNPRPIKNVTLAAPAVDVTLNPGEVAVLGAVAPTITLF